LDGQGKGAVRVWEKVKNLSGPNGEVGTKKKITRKGRRCKPKETWGKGFETKAKGKKPPPNQEVMGEKTRRRPNTRRNQAHPDRNQGDQHVGGRERGESINRGKFQRIKGSKPF